MAKIAVLVMGGHGHVNPTLALAEELVRRGHDVDYWATEEFRGTVESAGVGFCAYDSLMAKTARPPTLTSAQMLQMMPQRLLGETLHVLGQLAGPLDRDRPDLVLYDNMMLAGRVYAEARGLPAATLCTTYAGNERFNLLHGLGEPGDDVRRDYDEAMARIVAAYGVRAFPFTDLFGHAEPLNLVFMPRLWQPEAASFDDRFVFVGPCLGTRAAAVPLPAALLARKPLLFVSLGTAWNDKPDFYRTCFEAFGSSRWNVVMAVGTKVDAQALGDVPVNFTLRPHVAQLDVLRSADVFLTHGGMNSTMEALSLGVPLVALPQMFEQAQTARRIGELGVGLPLDPADVTASALREAVDRVAGDEGLRREANVVREAIQAAGGPRRAGDAVEAHLAGLDRRRAPGRAVAQPPGFFVAAAESPRSV